MHPDRSDRPEPAAPHAGERPGGFDYYMLRLARSDRPGDGTAGLVERLGTGEKRGFQSADELITVLTEWSAREANMQSGRE
jgi:hypothetical protein